MTQPKMGLTADASGDGWLQADRAVVMIKQPPARSFVLQEIHVHEVPTTARTDERGMPWLAIVEHHVDSIFTRSFGKIVLNEDSPKSPSAMM
jgi:hypothetical protein